MLFILTLFACDTVHKTYFYDISSTVLVSDENGQQIDAEDIEICQSFRSEDYDTTTSWQVQAEHCEQLDIDDGVAILSNWEGEYFGPDISIFVAMKIEEEVYEAELLHNDSEVWCDNAVVTEVDEHNNAIEYGDLCSENFERYLLWSLVLPSDTF